VLELEEKEKGGKMARKWIQKAIRRPGALRAAARRAGALRDGISPSWLKKQAKAPGRRGKQARLAITLKGLPRRRR